ncbi:MAG: hypothetical protein EA362_01085 [Saprospirales bacterium]|nr:MAG: hypothetical protein EA362_01085 [Saprospirales bacterium]
MKNIINFFIITILFLSSFSSMIGQGSNPAFVFLPDMTGYSLEDSPQHLKDDLIAAADALRAALPDTAMQNAFAVYDLGFYAHHPKMVGGIPEVMAKAISDRITHSYYLFFGREMDDQGDLKKVWVEVELPEGGYFSCIDSLSPTIRYELATKLRLNLNTSNLLGNNRNAIFPIVAKEEIYSLKDGLLEFKSCCPTETCVSCVYTDIEVFRLLLERNFILDPIKIINDPDFGSPPLAIVPGGTLSRTANDLNVEIGFLEDEVEVEADEYVNSFLSDDSNWIFERTGQSITHSVHLFKYPRDCNLFESKWEAYQNDPSDHKVFFVVLNVDNTFGVLGFHYEVSPPGGGFAPNESGNSRGMGFQGEYPYEDEIIGIQEVLDSANAACQNVLIGSMAVSSFEREKLTPEYRNWEWYRESVDKHLENWKVDLSEASYTLNIYWVKELEAVRKDFGYEDCWWFQACGPRTRWQATINVCRQTIHTALDICGFFFPVCDLANLTLYLQSGDLKNASFSAIGTLPLVGKAGFGIKYAAKAARQGTKKVMLQFSVELSGKVHWVGGRTKLYKLFKDRGFTSIFNGVQLTYSSAIHNAHHLIPWSLVDKATTKHRALMQRLARAGWHPSDPTRNGLIIPKNLPNGNTFHGSHASYNNWVDDALNEIKKLPDSQLSAKMDQLTDFLKLEIDKAYQANSSLHVHFGGLEDYSTLLN